MSPMSHVHCENGNRSELTVKGGRLGEVVMALIAHVKATRMHCGTTVNPNY